MWLLTGAISELQNVISSKKKKGKTAILQTNCHHETLLILRLDVKSTLGQINIFFGLKC